MNDKVRRRVLKDLTLSLPAAWSAPIVAAIVLPAHAQTSALTSVPSACGSEGGCYLIPGFDSSFLWPGGTGPFFVDLFSFTDPTCTDSPIGTVQVVVADDKEVAADLLVCTEDQLVADLPTVPPSDCSLYVCPATP